MPQNKHQDYNHSMRVQSLDRAFDIIEILSSEAHGMSLSDIAGRIDLPASTVHRLCASLIHRGYIEKKKPGNVYKLGLSFIQVASAYLGSLELKTEAHPYMLELSRKLEHPVFLATMMESEVVYIDRVDAGSASTLRNYSIIGQRKPAYSTGLGKSLLLGYSNKQLLEYMEKTEFVPLTSKTIIDKQKFMSEMIITRERGWALDDQEDDLRFRCVSAPVYDYRNTVIASISSSWDEDFFNYEEEQKVAPFVMKAARDISVRMGFID